MYLVTTKGGVMVEMFRCLNELYSFARERPFPFFFGEYTIWSDVTGKIELDKYCENIIKSERLTR